MPVADRKDTKTAILDAAERLMAEHGVNGVSLRSILTEAEANSAALHYHFGSREGLVEALLARRGHSSSVRRKELVDALAARSAPPTVKDMVRVIVDPMAEMLRREGDGGRRFFRFLARLQSDRADVHRRLDERHFPEMFAKMRPMMRKACPHLSDSELERRMNMVLDTMLQSLANAEFMTEEWRDDRYRDALDEHVESLKCFVAGGLAAPLRQASNHRSAEGD